MFFFANSVRDLYRSFGMGRSSSCSSDSRGMMHHPRPTNPA
jgi:hypothetical protein